MYEIESETIENKIESEIINLFLLSKSHLADHLKFIRS